MVTKFTMYVDMENDVLEIDNNDLNYSVIIENCNKVNCTITVKALDINLTIDETPWYDRFLKK